MYAIQCVQVHVIVQCEHGNQMLLERMGEKGNIVRVYFDIHCYVLFSLQ